MPAIDRMSPTSGGRHVATLPDVSDAFGRAFDSREMRCLEVTSSGRSVSCVASVACLMQQEA